MNERLIEMVLKLRQVPTVVIGVAARHIHSHSSIIHRSDYDDAVKILVELITRLDQKQVEALTA